MNEKPFRVLPRVTKQNEHFWQGGADGRLHLLRCQSCGRYVHPPSPRCPGCLGKDVQGPAGSLRAGAGRELGPRGGEMAADRSGRRHPQ